MLHAKIGQLTLENKGASGLAWVQVEPPTATVNRRLEILHVPEPASHDLDLLNLSIEPLTHRVVHRVLVTTPEEPQMREGLSARLRDRRRSATGIGTLPDVLQPAATIPDA